MRAIARYGFTERKVGGLGYLCPNKTEAAGMGWAASVFWEGNPLYSACIGRSF